MRTGGRYVHAILNDPAYKPPSDWKPPEKGQYKPPEDGLTFEDLET